MQPSNFIPLFLIKKLPKMSLKISFNPLPRIFHIYSRNFPLPTLSTYAITSNGEVGFLAVVTWAVR